MSMQIMSSGGTFSFLELLLPSDDISDWPAKLFFLELSLKKINKKNPETMDIQVIHLPTLFSDRTFWRSHFSLLFLTWQTMTFLLTGKKQMYSSSFGAQIGLLN